MRTLLLASLLILNVTYAAANQCEIDFDGNIQLEDRVLTLHTSKHKKIVIQQNNQLYVNDKQVVLSTEQQGLVSAYYSGIYAAAPQAEKIARDAIELANLTVNEVFTELLGTESGAVDDLSIKLDELSTHIHSNFYAQNGEIRLNSANFEDGNFLGNEWEEEFEQVIEEVVSHSIGKILLSLGSQLLFGGDDIDAFEAKMERFGQDMEQRLEYQTSSIEARANTLCLGLAQVDSIESQLQNSIAELADLNILRVTANYDAM